MLLLDLFFAGMETTVTTMKWGFLMSLIHQDVQAKIQEELDRCGERIRLSDQTRCPFTVATIKVIVLLNYRVFKKTLKGVIK